MRKPACVVVGVSLGRIVSFDQYFDPAPLRDDPMYQRIHLDRSGEGGSRRRPKPPQLI